MTAQLEGTVSTAVDDTVLSVTFSHTVPSMSNGILIVNVTWNNRELQTVDTVEFDGDPLTFIGQVTEDDDTRVEQWRLLAPAAKTANVVVTLTAALASDEGICCAAMNFSGVDQTTPIGNIATNSNSGSGTATVDISSSVGELVLDGAGTEDAGGPLVVGAGQTQLYNLASPVVGPRQEFSGGSTEPGAATVTMSWTLDASDRWGIIAMELLSAAGAVPPTVDAGGPYNGPSGQATALNATVTPGTDPTPALLWTIDSGGAGTFLPNATVEDPTFTPTFPTVGPYTLRLTVTPSDTPPVFDTAAFESDPVAPIVDAGGPYSGTVDTPIALDATVTPGTDPAPTLLWTIDSGPGTGVFSDPAIEDPTFTPDLTGTYTLRLTVTPSDGPAVFDTSDLDSQGFVPVAPQNLVGIKTDSIGRPIIAVLGIGAPLPAGAVILAGDALAFDGTLLVVLDDGAVPRTMVNGIPHTHDGVRIVTENPGDTVLNGFRLQSEPVAQCINDGPPPATPFYNKGFAIDGTACMFVVDGGSPPIPGPPSTPPDLANLEYWYDSTVQSTVWADDLGTIPISDGLFARRIDNNQPGVWPLFETTPGTGPIWRASGGPGNLPYLDVGSGTSLGSDSGPAPIGSGIAGCSVFGIGRLSAPSPSPQGLIAFSWQQGGVSNQFTQIINFTGEIRSQFFVPAGFITLDPGPVVTTDWHWFYGVTDAAGDYKLRSSGALEVTGNQTYTPIADGAGIIRCAGVNNDMTEFGIWRNKKLSDAELASLIAYIEGKYGGTFPMS